MVRLPVGFAVRTRDMRATRVMRLTILSIVLSIALAGVLSSGPALAQQASGAPPSQASSESAAAAPAWVTHCGSATRAAAVECSMEQRVLTTDTHQLLAMFSVRIPADTRAPVLMIQLPLGLYLPAGITLQVDQDTAIEMPVQTCDNAGCYAGAPLSGEFSTKLQRGQTLRLGFQNLSRTKLDVTMTLDGFGPALAAIK